MGYAFERAKYRRNELVQRNEGLLASSERRPSAFMHPELEAELPPQTLLIYELHNRDRKKTVSAAAGRQKEEDCELPVAEENSKKESRN
jgi:hypothetical protein